MHRFHVRLFCPENLKLLSCIISEYWSAQGLDGRMDVTIIPKFSRGVKTFSRMNEVFVTLQRFWHSSMHLRWNCMSSAILEKCLWWQWSDSFNHEIGWVKNDSGALFSPMLDIGKIFWDKINILIIFILPHGYIPPMELSSGIRGLTRITQNKYMFDMPTGSYGLQYMMTRCTYLVIYPVLFLSMPPIMRSSSQCINLVAYPSQPPVISAPTLGTCITHIWYMYKIQHLCNTSCMNVYVLTTLVQYK